MKRMVCEVCGGTDIVKEDGVFVCQSCGCKYSLDEVKKMMVEGTVDVSGSTVKVDNSAELENLYQIARRSKDSNNSENAAKYYDMILVKDPNSWEAYFFTVYYKSMSCKIGEIITELSKVENCIEDTFKLIQQNESNDLNRINAVKEVVTRTNTLVDLMSAAYESHYNSISPSIKGDYFSEYLGVTVATATAKSKAMECLINMFADDEAVMISFGYDVLSDYISDREGWGHIDEAKSLLARYEGIIEKHKKEEHEKELREARARYEAYWTEHAEEKNSLEEEKERLTVKIEELQAQVDEINKQRTQGVAELRKVRDQKVAEEIEYDRLKDIISDLETQRNNCSIFKAKEKKAIQARIDQEKDRLEELRKQAEMAAGRHKDEINTQISEIQHTGQSVLDEYTKLKAREQEIIDELTKER